MLINGISVVIERLPVGKLLEGLKQVTRLYTVHTADIAVQCQVNDELCLKASVDFLVDAAITTARVISEATVVEVIALGKGLFDQLTAAIDCGDYLTDVFRT